MVLFKIVARANGAGEIQYVLLEFLTPRGAQALCFREEESTSQEMTRQNDPDVYVTIEQIVNATGGGRHFSKQEQSRQRQRRCMTTVNNS